MAEHAPGAGLAGAGRRDERRHRGRAPGRRGTRRRRPDLDAGRGARPAAAGGGHRRGALAPGPRLPGALARRRTAETAAALRALGARAAEVIRLRLPDSGLAAREDELTAALAPLVAGFDLCLAPWDRDLHPDHEAAGRAARRAGPGRCTTTRSGCGTGPPPPIPGCPGTGRCASRSRRARPQEARGDHLLRQPDRRPGPRPRAGALPRHDRPLHPGDGGPAAVTLDPGYFRDRYAASPDPYGLAERWYEARKYALTVALLPRERYGAAFEPGCSIGVLTAQLAPRCDQPARLRRGPGRGRVGPGEDRGAARRAGRAAGGPGRVAAGARSTSSSSPSCSTTSTTPTWTRCSASASARCARAGSCSRCTGGTPRPTTRAPATRCTRTWPRTPGWPGWPATATRTSPPRCTPAPTATCRSVAQAGGIA